MNEPELADLLRRRNVKRVLYFHADHFEPWSRGINTDTLRGVERFAEQSRRSPVARKLSLFYSTYNAYQIAPPDAPLKRGVRAEGDHVVFFTHTDRHADEQHRVASLIAPLAEDGHEMHLHVHHEWWTCNSYNLDNPVSRWVNANSTPEMDERRLDLFTRIACETIAAETGRPFDRWGFVHGNWALCASDDQICRIENELEILMRHGGWGDFSFPAGRAYCDPKLLQPFTCMPIRGKRIYDDPASLPRAITPGAQALSPERFFIWNSPIKARSSSIDWYSEANLEVFREPQALVKNWISDSVSLGDTLFLKTHAHSMKWEYALGTTDNPTPHAHPQVSGIFDLFRTICDRAGVDFMPATINEVMTEISHIDGGKLDLTRSEPPATTASTDDRIGQLARALDLWIAADPVRIDQLGNFYSVQVKTGGVRLHNYEHALIDYVRENFDPAATQIVEVGPGLGLMAASLAAFGYAVTAAEGDAVRLAGLTHLSERLASMNFAGSAKLTVKGGWFPSSWSTGDLEPSKRTLLIATNVVNSTMHRLADSFLRAALAFDDLIIDVARFGILREERADQDALISAIRRRFDLASEPIDRDTMRYVHLRPKSVLVAETPTIPREFLTAEPGAPRLQPIEELARRLLDARRALPETRPDEFYADKMARGAFIEPHEVRLAARLLEIYNPKRVLMLEIGSGQGGLALLLGALGFDIVSYDGNESRHLAALDLRESLPKDFVRGKVQFLRGMFPKAHRTAVIEAFGKPCVALATNIVGTYSAQNAEHILRAIATLDEAVIDLSRLGTRRDEPAQKAGLLAAMASTHFEPLEPLLAMWKYEYWRFRVRPVLEG